MDCKALIDRVKTELIERYHIDIKEASAVQLHTALSSAVMGEIANEWRSSRRARESVRRAYYFSAEYLMGRMIFNNLYCLGILDTVSALLKDQGVDINVLEEIEDEALGNGGLGRLAACFLDSAATHGIPLDGYGLRYRFGLFKQTFKDGYQVEKADDWQRQGDPWARRREDKAVEVEFADQKVLAVPYDMAILGCRSQDVGTLRLWQSEAVEEFDFSLFNKQEYDLAVREKNSVEDITRVLYPNDSTYEGKRLRLKQQYFLASASLKDIIRRYKRVKGGDFLSFADHCAIQLNDTHPVLSVPELIRLLLLEGLEFEEAFEVARKTFCYTNHTVMAEALETWDTELIKSVVPGMLDIIYLINKRLKKELEGLGQDAETISRMLIVNDRTVYMANLAVYASSRVNGVSKIHTGILRSNLMRDWNAVYPGRFLNVTNGITQRRWLGLCNPGFSKLITGLVGDGFLLDLQKMGELRAYSNDESVIRRFNAVKLENKRRLSEFIGDLEGVGIPPHFIFDVQVKRMHEYKRQLLNAFSIMDLYFGIKDGRIKEFTPTAFIFGAKAAPGYIRAKNIIKYIHEVARKINCDPDMRELMKVVFVTNYNNSYAERIMPAADVSEQISTAGTEASGTGNMKLVLNGAVTLGTYDGANIEIVERAGPENNYLFGARAEDIQSLRAVYDPKSLYESEPRIRLVVDTLIDGTFSDGGSGAFRELYSSLLTGADWHRPDHYFILYDFLPYIEKKLAVNRDYRDRIRFGQKCFLNAAAAGNFSSDRTVREYAENIWLLGRSIAVRG
ncbi:MAG: Glycogen phosphorylase [Firmicutes bacterium ADurb.Bin182]|nr:MAG: Glycogen phosphorylase [Firmicutes bacterium ADurb.Bin182]